MNCRIAFVPGKGCGDCSPLVVGGLWGSFCLSLLGEVVREDSKSTCVHSHLQTISKPVIGLKHLQDPGAA